MGTAPTGKEVMMTGQTVHSFRDGRIAEAWWNFDTLGLLRQLGAVDL
jgi:predicted ester cyclase